MNNIGPNIAKALAEFQAEMPTVGKHQKANVGQYSYTYADLADVSSAVMPLLSKHGLSFVTLPTRKESGYLLVGLLMHESGESIEGEYPIQGNKPQDIGSSITYGRRYLLGCMTGVVTDDDDDGRLAQQAASRQQQPEIPRPAQRPTQPAETGELMKDATRARLFAMLNERGITEREAQIAGMVNVTGRQIESRSELTEREAQQVIEALREVPVVAGQGASE